jgi:bifunctional non-homologous end joining protein LigD
LSAVPGGERLSPSPSVRVEIGRRVLSLSNLDKVLWPEAGFTKGQMIAYYRAVAPALLPHLAGRPVTLKRYPDGVDGWCWFQTRCPSPPAWLRTHRVPSTADADRVFDYCGIEDEASLVWAANLAAIELHPLLCRADRLDRPAELVFDLDPGHPAGLVDCCRTALRLREALDGLGLASFPKTSGWLGLHVYVPLAPTHNFDDTKRFARSLARRLAREHPEHVLDRAERAQRIGRVFIDWSQNNPARSMVAPYSLRGASAPTVSMPLAWEEVERAVGTEDEAPLIFAASRVMDRLDRLGDLFRPALETEQALPT